MFAYSFRSRQKPAGPGHAGWRTFTLLIAGLAALGLSPALAGVASASPRPAQPAAVKPTYLWGVSCPDSGDCFAVGQHTHELGQPVAAIDRRHAGAWSAGSAPEPPGATSSVLNGVSCTSARACLAVGSYTKGTKEAVFPLAEKWNGTRWSLVKVQDPPDSGYTSLSGVWCGAAKDCWVVGNYLGDALAEHWSGSGWDVILPADDDARLVSVTCVSAGDCWATGSDKSGTLTTHWNGTTWSAVSTPTSSASESQLNGVSCAGASTCVAVGSGPKGMLSQEWNGTSWSLSVPGFSAGPEGVACRSGPVCMAVGFRTRGKHQANYTMAARWNGSAWSRPSTPNPADGLDVHGLQGVSCVTAADCWAVGGNADTGAPGLAHGLIEHWNGTKWSLVG